MRFRWQPEHKYQIGGAGTITYGANTIKEAKARGNFLARQVQGGKWNVGYVLIKIWKRRSPGSHFWISAGWAMAVPVPGTGRRREAVVAEIKRRYGVKDTTWFRQ